MRSMIVFLCVISFLVCVISESRSVGQECSNYFNENERLPQNYSTYPGLQLSKHQRMFYHSLFSDWMKNFDITVQSNEDYASFFLNFIDNEIFISSVNKLNLSYSLGHNQFSHMTQDEWRQYVHLGSLQHRKATSEGNFVFSSFPNASIESVDWVSLGAVTGVKNQGDCGSCWSFSTTGAIEGAHFVKYGSLKSYSEQNLIDCDKTDGGCEGGQMTNALDWAQKNGAILSSAEYIVIYAKLGGLCLETDYPYISYNGDTTKICNLSCNRDIESIPSSFVEVPPECDSCLAAALSKQPVSVAIEADHREFQLYSSGIFSANCGSSLDHGVLAVGYGIAAISGERYYKIKNSWGSDWGMSGYILLSRDRETGNEKQRGKCGILTGPPVFPVM